MTPTVISCRLNVLRSRACVVFLPAFVLRTSEAKRDESARVMDDSPSCGCKQAAPFPFDLGQWC